MKELSSEVLYVLLFMAFMLVQFLTQRGKRAAAEKEAQAEAERAAQAEAERAAQAQAEAEQAARAGEAGVPARRDEAETPPLAQPAQPRPANAASLAASAQTERMRVTRTRSATGTSRRYSRHALFGDKRRTQDAVVVATILGPCRAFEPYQSGP